MSSHDAAEEAMAEEAKEDSARSSSSYALMELIALTVLLGLQCFKVFLPLMAFLLRDRLGWDPAQLGLLAVGLFGLGFFVPWVVRNLGLRRALVASVGLLAAFRLGLQLWQGDPVGDLVFAALGLGMFVVAAPIVWIAARNLPDRESSADALAIGWVLGLLLELIFHIGFGTWDLAWREGWVFAVAVLSLVAATVHALWGMWTDLPRDTKLPGTVSLWAWFGVWPLFYLYAAFLGFPARVLASASDHSHDSAMMLAFALAIGAGPWWVKLSQVGRLASVTCAALLLFGVSTGLISTPLVGSANSGLGPLIALACLGVLISFLLRRAVCSDEGGFAGWLAFTHGGAMLLLFAFTFATTSAWQVRMPISTAWLPVFAAVVVGACAWRTGVHRMSSSAGVSVLQETSLWAVALGASALVGWAPTHFPGDVPERPQRQDWPLRVVTYNVHCGIDPLGRLDPEAIAETLKAESPDVVILQEVSRGWLLNGGIDLPDYLAHRLSMNFEFHGTAEGIWGNAVLTRLPVLSSRRGSLPPYSLLLRRGVLDVQLGLAGGDTLRVLATHFHHPHDGWEARLSQSRRVLIDWDQRPQTLIAGDLNAKPFEPEIGLLKDAGFRDALDLAGEGDGFTFPSWDPVRRIDYLLMTPDLTASKAWVSPSTASDHAAVVAVIRPQNEPPTNSPAEETP